MQYIVTLVKGIITKTHLVNCANEFSAKVISEFFYPEFEVVEVKKNT